MTYKNLVEQRMKDPKNQLDEKTKLIYTKANQDLLKKALAKDALQVGDQIPHIQLSNHLGEMIDVDALLKKGPMIISFYRGAWCPYCNLELMLYQQKLKEIEDLGASFIAISPDLPDQSLTLSEKRSLKYHILSDIDNQVAKQFHLVFKVDADVIDIYNKKGFDLKKYQGNDLYELPMPATYIVDEQGTIRFAYVNELYVERLEPTDAIQALKKLSGEKDA